MVVCRGRKQYTARFGQGLEARRDIDPIPIQISTFNHHIAEVDPEAKHNAALFRQIPVGAAECLLQLDGALNRVDRAGEFHQDPVARDFEDAALMPGDERFKHVFAARLEDGEGAGLIGFHQAAEADDISGQYGGKSALNAFSDRGIGIVLKASDRPNCRCGWIGSLSRARGEQLQRHG